MVDVRPLSVVGWISTQILGPFDLPRLESVFFRVDDPRRAAAARLAMSQTKDQLHQLEELDARVDALVEDIHASSAAVQSGVADATQSPSASNEPPAHDDIDDDADEAPVPSAIDPALGTPPRTPFTFDESDFSSAQSVLEEVSGEIEHEAPGAKASRPEEVAAPVMAPAVPAPAEPSAVAAAPLAEPAASAAPRSDAPAAAAPVPDQEHVSEHASLDAALADAAEELASAQLAAEPIEPVAAPAARTTEVAASVPEATEKPVSLKDEVVMAAAAASAEHPHEEPENDATPAPVADIQQLDQALAANADKALEDAQRELDQHAATAAANPEPEPAAPVAETPATAAAAPSPVPAAAPPAPAAKPASPAPQPAPAAQPPLVEILPSEPQRSKVALLSAALLAPLRPIAALHEKFGESTRQTIGYIAVMNVFFASVVWFFALQKPVTRDPVSMGAHAYHSDEEAATAKAAHAAAHTEKHSADAHGAEPKSDGHGASGHDSGHGEKKPEAKKSSADHGSDSGHGAKKAEPKKADAKKAEAKKTAAKPAKKKSDAKADAHGGH